MKEIKIAVLDLYNGEENQGIRCIKDIINETSDRFDDAELIFSLFDLRAKNEIPNLDYDIYISSGGPGSPFEGEGSEWENKYFGLLSNIDEYNKRSENKKFVFFICHSFQLMARHYRFAKVTSRHSPSFGIMEIYKVSSGFIEPLFHKLNDPFYGADFREYQVVQPRFEVLNKLGARIIAIEKERPHVQYERAIMGVRISDEIVGLQFHPEADPASMLFHLHKPERKEQVVKKYGEKKYFEMLSLAEDPNALKMTRNNVLPEFLNNAVKTIISEKLIYQ
ncbi:hypothetical protein ASZ90_005144 [hydrocarbon metagenome]|uniref:Glutamine amidotransferase domain-containing protein n=1 Tax=hydrocarbon metagenome TaxID=938273 RepID=A0A0W8FW17_9ZZZZ